MEMSRKQLYTTMSKTQWVDRQEKLIYKRHSRTERQGGISEGQADKQEREIVNHVALWRLEGMEFQSKKKHYVLHTKRDSFSRYQEVMVEVQ